LQVAQVVEDQLLVVAVAVAVAQEDIELEH